MLLESQWELQYLMAKQCVKNASRLVIPSVLHATRLSRLGTVASLSRIASESRLVLLVG
jgi:hypothetical protein